MRGLTIALAIALALAGAGAGAPSAYAGGVGLLVVAPREQRPAVVAAMAAALRDRGALRIAGDALAEAREAATAGAVPISTMVRFRRVREQIDEGWRAYHNVQLEFATSRLAAARTDAESLLALPGMPALYADASLRLGAVLAQRGRTGEARDAIALALALDPDRPITQLEFSPEVVATVDRVRGQRRPTHPVHVTSEPPGATVSIDGHDVGRTPLDAELAAGQHVIVARMAQFDPYARAFALDDKTAELPFALDHDDQAAELGAGLDAGTSQRTQQLVVDRVLELADLDQVVLVAATERRGGPTLLVQRCAGAPARCTAVVELGYADPAGVAVAAREAWHAARSADLRYPPNVFDDPRLIGNLEDHRCKLCRNPIVWAGVGVAAVAAAIAIIAVASSSRPPPIVTVGPGFTR
ncbi:MAG: PEGA domain-containing protein [Kofleriaceae bacterium]